LPKANSSAQKKRKAPPSPQVANIRTKVQRISGSQDDTTLVNPSEGQQGTDKEETHDVDEEEARVPNAAFDLTFEFELKVQTMTKGGKARSDKPKMKVSRDTKTYTPFTMRMTRITLTELRSKLANHTKQASNEIVWETVDWRSASKAASHDRTFPQDVKALDLFLAEMSRTKTKRCIIVWPPADVGKEASEEVEEVGISH
jgi:hypothetical protein